MNSDNIDVILVLYTSELIIFEDLIDVEHSGRSGCIENRIRENTVCHGKHPTPFHLGSDSTSLTLSIHTYQVQDHNNGIKPITDAPSIIRGLGTLRGPIQVFPRAPRTFPTREIYIGKARRTSIRTASL